MVGWSTVQSDTHTLFLGIIRKTFICLFWKNSGNVQIPVDACFVLSMKRGRLRHDTLDAMPKTAVILAVSLSSPRGTLSAAAPVGRFVREPERVRFVPHSGSNGAASRAQSRPAARLTCQTTVRSARSRSPTRAQPGSRSPRHSSATRMPAYLRATTEVLSSTSTAALARPPDAPDPPAVLGSSSVTAAAIS